MRFRTNERRIVLVSLVVGAQLLLLSCARTTTISGQLFITTNEGSSVKLGGVDILAFTERDIQSAIGRMSDAEKSEKTKLRAAADASQKVVDDLEEKYRPLKNKQDALNAAVTAGLKAESKLIGSPSFGSAQRHVLALLAEGTSLRATVLPVASALDDAVKINNVNRSRLESWPTSEFYFSGLPRPVASAMTNADGNFSLVVPTRSKFALAAHAVRNLPAGPEQFYWLIWVDSKDHASPFLVTNRNLATSGAPGSVVKARAATLPPLVEGPKSSK